MCGSDVISFRDPHINISNPDDWVNTGLAKNVALLEGRYFVTVQVRPQLSVQSLFRDYAFLYYLFHVQLGLHIY